eukprot:Selendium_serpulae@DN6309_c0_g1_i3.p1
MKEKYQHTIDGLGEHSSPKMAEPGQRGDSLSPRVQEILKQRKQEIVENKEKRAKREGSTVRFWNRQLHGAQAKNLAVAGIISLSTVAILFVWLPRVLTEGSVHKKI